MLEDLVRVLKEGFQRALSSDAAQEIHKLLDDFLGRHDQPAAAERPAAPDPAAPAEPPAAPDPAAPAAPGL